MNFLFYCAGDDGSMLDAFRNALHPKVHTVFSYASAPDSSTPQRYQPDTIDAAIVWQPPDDFFDGLSQLTHIYAVAAGVDQLLKHPGLPENAALIRLRDAGMAVQMAEYVLYGVLRAQRNFHEFEQAQRHGRWVHGAAVRQASDTQVGILGAGVLAREVAVRLQLNGYPVSCWSRSPKTMPSGVTHKHSLKALPDFLSNCDVLVCLLALTDETKEILNEQRLYQLKRGAFVINCARGQHVQDAALLQALDDSQISGAMLDVFESEPLAPDHAFWKHPRIMITPHEAARSLPDESVKQVIESIAQVESGQLPEGIVDRSRGY